MLHLRSEWETSLDKGETFIVNTLEISGAFHRVWPEGLAAKLPSLSIEGELLHVIIDYVNEKTLIVLIIGKCPSERLISASVAKGIIIRPLLWSVYFNDLPARAFICHYFDRNLGISGCSCPDFLLSRQSP